MFVKNRRRKGAVVVEFAVVLPLLLMIFAVIVEISRLLLLQQTADTAAYEGARHAMVPGATADEGIAEAKRLLEQARIINAQITIEPETITEDTASIAVHVKIPIATNSWFFKNFSDSANVTSDVALICERVPLIQLTGIPSIKAKATKGKGSKVDL